MPDSTIRSVEATALSSSLADPISSSHGLYDPVDAVAVWEQLRREMGDNVLMSTCANQRFPEKDGPGLGVALTLEATTRFSM